MGLVAIDEWASERVEVLLRAAEKAGDFLEEPPTGLSGDAGPTALMDELSEKPGDKIGRYQLLQQIGEGGCGIVYMAEQVEPVRRRVAIKVIKLGMDTKSVIARFEAERFDGGHPAASRRPAGFGATADDALSRPEIDSP